ncbi:hypothetical protein LCGC14_2686310 [marine sediment metagenome]|uniref:Uncharacterized protein n=1 Tax=marine sediment metagenome TaxID=412755 RepID=A0A0F9BUK2_9ZZZZ
MEKYNKIVNYKEKDLGLNLFCLTLCSLGGVWLVYYYWVSDKILELTNPDLRVLIIGIMIGFIWCAEILLLVKLISSREVYWEKVNNAKRRKRE